MGDTLETRNETSGEVAMWSRNYYCGHTVLLVRRSEMFIFI